jgi:hypothetical protein
MRTSETRVVLCSRPLISPAGLLTRAGKGPSAREQPTLTLSAAAVLESVVGQRPWKGGHSMSGLPISQWWPKGSAMRPSSQPCWGSAG